MPRFLSGRGRTFLSPTLFFLAAIYYGELCLKLFCFQDLPLSGVLFTFLFTVPPAMLLGLACASLPPRWGRPFLVLTTGLICLWLGAQIIYFRLFKTFLTIFSLTKMAMVAGAFGGMALPEVLLNWFPVLTMVLPVASAWLLRRRLIPDPSTAGKGRLTWAALALTVQMLTMGLVLCCGEGVLSLRDIYFYTATPELETQYFGALTQSQLEVRRVFFGILPDFFSPGASSSPPAQSDPAGPLPNGSVGDTPQAVHTLPIDFDTLIAEEENEELLPLHWWLSQREPTAENQWTGYFEGKNLVWVVAEGFSSLAMDPERTPTLWKLSHEGFVCEHFYTPLWGVSTSDGEYVTTTGLIPKSGVWSYSLCSKNYMPFSLGNQFRKEGYRTFAFHDYLYDYYDRDQSHPNMGYEYYALGQGLTSEDLIPPEYLADEDSFPPSDEQMMKAVVPMFVEEEPFMVYCLTVSGHLPYNREENIMADRHWDCVADSPYSDGVKSYLACQMELERAMTSLVEQLEAAGKLEDTVIVLSADHYPYGLTDEEYSELLGHPVDPVFEIYENTLILWSAGMENPVPVEKYCSSLDLLPTLSNLFGLEYDSRLLMGSDILSDRESLVIFSSYSFINDRGFYSSAVDRFYPWQGGDADPEEVSAMVAEVQNRVAYSALILDHDYYRTALNGPPRDEDHSLDFFLPPWDDDTRPEHSQQP